MIQEILLRVLPEVAADTALLRQYVADEKGLALSALKGIRVLKRSIDARQRTIFVNLKVRLYINEQPTDDEYVHTDYPDVSDKPQVIVVGAGPGGLFAALRLIELGLRPIVLERGKDVHERKKDLAAIARTQQVDAESNYCFGEGGAGAYSDGKLYTRSKKRGSIEKILNVFCQHGASTAILADAHPHIGTDRLPQVIEAMRNTIIRCGGEVHFQTKMVGLIIDHSPLTIDHSVIGVKAQQTVCLALPLGSSKNVQWSMVNGQCSMFNGQCPMVNVQCSMFNGQCSMFNGQCSMVNGQCPMVNGQCSMVNGQCSMVNGQCPMVNGQCSMVNEKEFFGPVILATGHSARDVYRYFAQEKIEIEAKGIAVGVRLEHPSKLIDQIQYHRKEGRGQWLPAAEYSFVTQVDGRGVYSFCMCPGGFVIPAATGPEQVVVNGMSPASRGTQWSNSGMVVELRPEDIEGDDVLRVMHYQEELERMCWQQSNMKQTAPAQRMSDFVNGKLSYDLPRSSYAPGLVSSPLHFWMPKPIVSRLQQGFKVFGRQAHGFLTNEAVMIGVETRTSSPVRIVRDNDTLQHIRLQGLFPCGEGAGYAGGIVSAGVDGERCAEMCALWLNNNSNQVGY